MLTFTVQGIPTKKPLIFLHGFLGQKEDFDKTISYLKESFYCISLELRSSKIEDPFQQIVFEIKQVIYHLDLKDPVLIGYSMGGRIAHVFQHTSNISCQSIMMGSHLGLTNFQEKVKRFQWEEMIINKLTDLSISDFIDYWYQMPIFTSFQSHSCFASTLTRRKNQNNTVMKGLFSSFRLTKQPIYPPHPLSHFFCGQYDKKYIEYYPKEKVYFHTIKKAGHVIHLESPKELARNIQEVLHDI